MRARASVLIFSFHVAILPGTGALAGAATKKMSAAEARHRMIVVGATDSQGFDRCAAADRRCGKTFADSLCLARGLSASVSFGPSDDMTGTTLERNVPNLPPGSFIIDCGK